MSASLVITVEVPSDASSEPARLPYEPPRVLASASLEQITLFSGGVADGGVIFGD
jgi:hypothetical protein